MMVEIYFKCIKGRTNNFILSKIQIDSLFEFVYSFSGLFILAVFFFFLRQIIYFFKHLFTFHLVMSTLVKEWGEEHMNVKRIFCKHKVLPDWADFAMKIIRMLNKETKFLHWVLEKVYFICKNKNKHLNIY